MISVHTSCTYTEYRSRSAISQCISIRDWGLRTLHPFLEWPALPQWSWALRCCRHSYWRLLSRVWGQQPLLRRSPPGRLRDLTACVGVGCGCCSLHPLCFLLVRISAVCINTAAVLASPPLPPQHLPWCCITHPTARGCGSEVMCACGAWGMETLCPGAVTELVLLWTWSV